MSEPNEVRILLSGRYAYDGIDRLIRDIAGLDSVAGPRDVLVDLSSLIFLGPSALAVLAAAIRRVEKLGGEQRAIRVAPPLSPQVSNYLMRMDFLSQLELVGPPEPFIRKDAVGFRPLQTFRRDLEYSAVAATLTDALCEKCITDRVARYSVRICLDEVMENVFHHADSTLGGFAAAQGWQKDFEIGIVDRGVGIRASLEKNPRYADIGDDSTAIATALRERVTSTPERNAGIGLFITKELLAANGGLILVRSGNGLVIRGSRNEQMNVNEYFDGTLVAIRARLDRPLDIGAVYRGLDAHHDDNQSNESNSSDD